eukprot:TRINITY_DN7287_c0_g1_i2.p1 TRINITY_DN7287_c0_g1~~TRINITY_DN7287_c0_g1_i2.p1  ORF type:complete len:217 (+),score=40.28 TRINITY_DN7287_c0_g1_i2:3-653(+)
MAQRYTSRALLRLNGARNLRLNALRTRRLYSENSVGQTRAQAGEGSLVEGTKTWAQLTPAEKVVEGSKDAGSAGIILAGFSLCGIFLYSVASELFFSSGPEKYFKLSVDRVTQDEEVQLAIGSDIKAIEPVSQGRRLKQWKAAEYVVKDTQYTRMSYLIEGPRGDGTVHLEMKKPKGGSPSVRYLFADVQGMTGRTQRIVIEDNRIEDEQPSVAAE